MTAQRLGRKVAMMIALAGLGACLAGCVSDLGAASNASDQQAMRYYGGPKYPMWRAPAEN
ncbi:hypothetical protein FXB40_05980 [Bradyrhizobium rifense]|jgi:hypothetical protein|uniref:Lipoprotein n=1 Tax=Bradyrhizobium rifense TaxID=515499 RepID=A0A5D3KXA1_9BRAD|nr:hypothetical protein [Bradyrhizobium rifense]TYL98029.1 hypothetical protein FXB40_05980 [Bradyrhizobium rifense]